MAVNAFLTFFDKADGESIQKGHEKWVELQGWDWEVEAESSWTKGAAPVSANRRREASTACMHSMVRRSWLSATSAPAGHSRRSSST